MHRVDRGSILPVSRVVLDMSCGGGIFPRVCQSILFVLFVELEMRYMLILCEDNLSLKFQKPREITRLFRIDALYCTLGRISVEPPT